MSEGSKLGEGQGKGMGEKCRNGAGRGGEAFQCRPLQRGLCPEEGR